MESMFHVDLNTHNLPFASVVNVGPVAGGEAFLLRAKDCNILFDTGFGCGGDLLVQRLRNELEDQALDYILLSHSHYDRAPAAAWCIQEWPTCKIVAGYKTKSVFSRPGAIATMRRLDSAASEKFNIHSSKDYFDKLRVDIPLSDGESFVAGNNSITLLQLPGHTNCSVGYWLPDCGLLMSSESLGVYVPGSQFVVSALLTGFSIGIESIKRCADLPIEHMLIPHCGLIHGAECHRFLQCSLEQNYSIQTNVRKLIDQGFNREELRIFLKDYLYRGAAREIQPEEAFDENSGYIIDTMIREYNEIKMFDKD